MKLSVPLLFFFVISIFAGSAANAQNRYWVFFKNKPEAAGFTNFSYGGPAERYLMNHGVLTTRCIQRRLKVLPASNVVSVMDFPVYSGYIDSLELAGLKVIGTSRWFNAATVLVDSLQLTRARRFSFVKGTRPVASAIVPISKVIIPAERPGMLDKVSSVNPSPGADSSFYGPSLTQLELEGIPQVQSLGIDGNGVLVGMLDAGFRYETHDALKHIKIVGEHDFIQNDSITANQPGDSSYQDNHGTSTLSVLGGYSPGNLIGVAYGASFMLAKTEYVPVTDFKWEEDNWVEGLEWMEARGVDVVSSSVAYNDFVYPNGTGLDSAISYFFSRGDFNGKTSYASRAATIAAHLGVVVVQAMGNEGNGNGVVATMDVPADADSIISVGAVDMNGRLTAFSSTGPTNDGRTKPDLVADGMGDYVAVVPGPDTYAYESGTSFSTPITAGIAALILSVRPDYTPMQVINLLKSTAVQHYDPDIPKTRRYPNNFYGWGIVNAWNAIKKLGLVSSNTLVAHTTDSLLYVSVKAYSTSGIDLEASRAYYSYDGVDYTPSHIFATDTLNQYGAAVPGPVNPKENLYFYFSLVDSAGKQLDVPFYGPGKPFVVSGWQVVPVVHSDKFHLYAGYPDPFTSVTHVAFILYGESHVTADVFDVLGRKVCTIFDGTLPAGYEELSWNGTAAGGRRVSSGVYFIRLVVGGSMKVSKVLLLR